MKMPQRALIKRILLSAVACLSIMLFHQFQGVIIEGVRGPLPRVILDTGCLPPPRRGDDKIALVASYFVPPAQPTTRADGDTRRRGGEVGPSSRRLLPLSLPGGDGVPVARVKQFIKLAPLAAQRKSPPRAV